MWQRRGWGKDFHLGLPKPSFRDEVTDRLERYADAMGYLKISLAEYNLVKRSDDDMAEGLWMR